MNLSLLAGILSFIIGIVYTLQAYLLPDATIGKPMAPKVFPIVLGILLICFGGSLIIQEVKKTGFKLFVEKKTKNDQSLKLILYTCCICIVYALTFNKLGYVLSTILFLEMMLLLFRGKEKWKMNTIISVSFSVLIYITFSKFLGITLPSIPFIYI
ncbi:tripartite tricarboxylate transporter TctB family protein [Maledivibacter halophilus]|uniref:Putative tricarboxylic transport membrane protein n=1 Tax=Maledivibacter halophilus TaxID=36842 RepID=A0A1T5JAZ0_9FIRM|nr:tripartite tricarboxylate transporter TctB family protein [Maledivibacter halophilus]SKC48403.1 putative tricarboxylic transport membrane protein [Maledivibacter halophilus]